MTNRNKKILDESQRKQFERKKSIFREIIFFEFITSFSVIIISIFFLLISVVNVSTFYSMILAVFSTLITLSFEITEWTKFMVEKRKKKRAFILSQILYYNTYGLFICVIILVIIMFCFKEMRKYIPNLFENIPVSLPNIITTITLSIYFVSYSVRCLVKECCDFRKKYGKYYKKTLQR